MSTTDESGGMAAAAHTDHGPKLKKDAIEILFQLILLIQDMQLYPK